ncbi:hypothetical protein AB0I27_22570 [Streptomyces sp. NPDC050597]|uniref:hypothetical protein n=1 Tax=Streptomyces sp. NPDC050597 TaxID=3157212 RepID=UPI00341571BD
MSTAGTTHVQCPECDALIPIVMILKSPIHEGNMLIVNVEPDLTDVMAHVWSHEVGDEGE